MNAPRASSLLSPSPLPAARRADNRRSGFALLITITLLAFLVLLLVSLASLTRVETQVAANNQQISQARQNALMALNVAIGQLQKYAGADQRTTARADLDGNLANVTNQNGRWLGVYGSAVAASYADTPLQVSDKLAAAYDAADPLLKKGSQARLLNWLVSGNENTAFNPATDVAADGHITAAPASFAFTPASTVDLTTVSTSPAASATQALLVGPNSVTAPSDYVAAPLRSIAVAPSQIPGAAPAGGDINIGRYAWWVGDEGAKARINLSASTVTQPAHAFVAAQRTAVELVDGVNAVGSTAAFATGQLIGPAAYDPSSSTIPRLLSGAQLPMLSSAHATALETARKFRFHDLTAASQSVLSDTYAGGLKKDLSAVLATGAPAPADTDYLFTPASTAARDIYGVPTWGKLRSFVRPPSTGTALIEPRLPSTTDVGVYPIITYVAAGFQYVNQGGSLRLAMFPVVVLWNPYTAPIKGGTYEVGINSLGGRFQLQSRIGTGPWVAKETRNLSNGLQLQGTGTAKSYLRFQIDATATSLLPGESRIFALQGSQSGGNYTLAGGAPANVLTPGLNILGHVFASDEGAAVAPGETDFRVAGDGSQHVPTYGGNFRNEMCAYLGQVSTVPPVGPEMPQAGKPWYQAAALVAMSGTPASPLLQESVPNGVTGAGLWGVSLQMSFGNRVRWIANNNVRAPFMSKTGMPGTRAMISKQGKDTWFQLFSFDPSPDGRASSSTASSTTSGLDVNPTTDEPIDSILFELRPSDQPLLSLGQLQHANLSWHQDIPAYPLGNSLADMFHLNPNKTDRDRLYRTAGSSGSSPPINLIGGQYDISYLLNRALWDRYFVSTVPHAGTGTSSDTNTTGIPDLLPNSRLIHDRSADLRDTDKAAAHLLLNGGFNINSTSEQAWRAVLGGINRLEYDPEDAAAAPGTPLNAALPRFARPPVAPAYDSSKTDWAFKGYRQLTEEQIAQLAREIVREVRNRGPFISLADFVNRRLKDNPASTTHGTSPLLRSDETLKGPLQAAIDATTSGSASINNHHGTAPFNSAMNSDATDDDQLDADGLVGGRVANSTTLSVPPIGSKSAFAPQFLTQADVLSSIGSGLSARSDTFTIRTYGDVLNPVTGDISGRAWCEAVVQRVVEPVRRKNNTATDPDYNEPAAGTAAQPDFGRRFQIISFRWLSSNDI
ncbi:MAG: hypothetical protein K0R17_512 [Rariglobus sp.]|jgi:hypothetical protein|nr:hypothetical protein [Rariglobus sp.]